jgi:putative ABC transport system permease protein
MVLAPQGLVLSTVLGEALGVAPGDSVTMRVLQGTRPVREVRVAGLAEDFAGIAAYMDLTTLNTLLGEGDRASGAHLSVAEGQWEEFLTALKRTPQVSGAVIKDSMRESFRSTTAENIGLLQSIYLLFAVLVACGIVYNSARIALSERTRELATMRVMGFSQREVGGVLVGELVLLAVLALPIGLVLGSGLARAILAAVNTETVRLPLILTPANYAYAILVISLATAVSATLACRKLNRLDLVGVLKARD